METSGPIIWRYGNRIANASFSLDSVTYTLSKNDETNCLHGGPEGFHTKVWTAEQPDEKTLKLTYLSSDGEAGFLSSSGSTLLGNTAFPR